MTLRHWTLVLAGFAQALVAHADDTLEFNRDIRPILSENCFSCHGFDEKTREAGLRLDQSDPARAELASGHRAIVPGSPDTSELVRRILSTSPDDQMPPPDSGKMLTAQQKERLQQWIRQGAPYEVHWSFTPIRRPAVPRMSAPEASHWARNPIDDFILQQLQQARLTPAPAADRQRLLRRLSLDVTGLPPELDEIDEFINNPDPDAFEQVLDRMMASPRFGERMALDWLDAARYADTHGFNNDTTRYMWRWRDWTIDALNAGMPFDQFVTEQLAGDLLPEPTLSQRIATGFNRNHVINSEGGIIPEEYRVEYVADRVHTTATILMGMSLSCARCHDHKFDPFTQREYYQFFAFFNNLNEQGEAGRVGNAEPTISAPTDEQAARLKAITQQIERTSQQVAARTETARQTIADWEPSLRDAFASATIAPPARYHWPLDESTGSAVAGLPAEAPGTFAGKPKWAAGRLGNAAEFDGNSHIDLGNIADFERTDKFSYGGWVYLTSRDAATVISRMDDADSHRGYDLLLVGGKLTAHLIHHWPDNALHVVTKADVPLNQWKHVFATYDGSSRGEGFRLYVDGALQETEITNKHLDATVRTARTARIGRRTPGAPCRGRIDDVRIYDRELTPTEVAALAGSNGIRELLDIAAADRTPAQTEALVRAYLDTLDPEARTLQEQLRTMTQQRTDLEKAIPTAMVMVEMPQPRKTFVLKRGQYDLPDEEVIPQTPASLPPFPAEAPRNRLGLAAWLLAPNHPLTSRVAVNRTWNLFVGTGIVETVEDFGSQGEWPTHLDLLNWLSAELMSADRSGLTPWDVKRLQRLMLSSATYQQSSRITPTLQEVDPQNRLLARGSRFRLPAEAIRDNALALAGLLSDRIGGPSVSPYQPAGLWDDVAVGADYEGTVYRQDHGEGLYRRSLYTFWKRTCPPPGLNTFDAPEREVCTARRSRTNTPLQALVLMNDPTYLEAARRLAERVLTHGGTTAEARITYAFRVALSRSPGTGEIRLARGLVEQRQQWYSSHPAEAAGLLTAGESPRTPGLADDELAAWTSLMSVILNLDELITKG